MSNEFFTPSSVPANSAPGASATIRAEFAAVAAAFNKLPAMVGNGGEIVSVNSAGTALEASGVLLANLITLSSVGTIINKTFTWADNTWVGFGSAATRDAGVGAGNVLLLQDAGVLPVMNGWNLTNLNPAALGVIPISGGGTGVTTLEDAKDVLGVNAKANSVSAILTGNPIAPTPAAVDYSERLATTKFVADAVGAAVITAGSLTLGSSTPLMDGVAAAGTASTAAKSDHVHPSDTSKANTSDLTSGLAGKQNLDATLTGLAAMTVAAANLIPVSSAADTFITRTFNSTNTLSNLATSVASESIVKAYVDAADALKAPLASPALTGVPTCPTNTGGTANTATTQIVNQAYLEAWRSTLAAGVAVSSNNPLMDGAVSPGTSADASRVDHRHPSDTTRASLGANTFTGHQTLPGGGAGLQAATVNDVASAVATHVALGDPHPLYALESSLGTAALVDTGVASGDVPLVSNILGKHVVCIPGAAMKPRITAGASAATIALSGNGTLVTSLNFHQDTENFAQFSHTAPDSLDPTVQLACAFKWSHPVTTVNFKVAWAVRAKFIRNDDTIDGAWSAWVQVNGTGGTTDDQYNTGDALITPAGTYADGCKIYWEVKRVAGDVTNDTLNAVARLDEFSFKYTTNALNDN